MLRISTTTLESFRRLLETEYQTEAEIIDGIKGKPFAPSWQMEAGTAWHHALEGTTTIAAQRKVMCMRKTTDQNVFWLESAAAQRAEQDTEHSGLDVRAFPCEVCGLWHIGKPTGNEWLIRDGAYAFADYDVERGRQAMGAGVREVKATRIFDVNGTPVNVVAKADHCHGHMVTDAKTKFGQVDEKDYEASLQWRFYLAVHGATTFRYVLFSFRDPKDGYCELTAITDFRFFPYVGLDDDCLLWLTAFMDWARERNLLGYLERQGTGNAA